ncbi:contactin isoform X2 [Folsomia candida]|uniref:contactin isoform X2 n=1 Tax=Folsomia candida TaxID=158441 RepID=UPI00160531CB|nr:contactin isoform X2 [Folsomia candida]
MPTLTILALLKLIYFCSISMTNGQFAPPSKSNNSENNPIQHNGTLENTNNNQSISVIHVDNADFDVGDTAKIPRGPFFIEEPTSQVYDISGHPLSNVTLRCVADGWPAPTYSWFKEEYQNNTLVDPLKEQRYTVTNGTLVIHEPNSKLDRGNYHCTASNKFGSIISETVSLSFGYIAEFLPVRSTEYAHQFWGKAMYCEPPQHFPAVHYNWSRGNVSNFVQEDEKIFASHDGNLYFTSVDMSDSGKYSCNVESTVSGFTRNGPFFTLQVIPHGPKQPKFFHNFPKVFPESPKAMHTVRLECVAYGFGHPVPTYNWTRKGSGLPGTAILSNYDRVLVLKNVTVEDQGEYVCGASNNQHYIESSVTLSIQAAPRFTIRLENKQIAKNSDHTWTCEASGIPDVSYEWFKNGVKINTETLPPEDIGRYFVQDNVLKIIKVDEERDPGMYQCRISNALGARFSSAQLNVVSDPEAVQSSGTLKTISSLQGDVQNLDNAKRDGWVIELPLRSVTGGGWASWYMLL